MNLAIFFIATLFTPPKALVEQNQRTKNGKFLPADFF
jgi:hypothetical protein